MALLMIRKAFEENGIKIAVPTVQVSGGGDDAAAAGGERNDTNAKGGGGSNHHRLISPRRPEPSLDLPAVVDGAYEAAACDWTS